VGGRRGLGLHADHRDARVDGLGDDAGPRRPAAASDGDHDRFDVGLLFEELEGLRGDAGHEVRLVR
jgi:hypothetical protein